MRRPPVWMERRRPEERALIQAPGALHELGARLAGEPSAAWEWIERFDPCDVVGGGSTSSIGAVATPWTVARLMARQLLQPMPRGRTLRLLDAGCGGGRLLAAAAQQAAELGLELDCHGVDIDPLAARRARGLEPLVRVGAGDAVAGWHVRHGDYLLTSHRGALYDAAIANPPYASLRGLEPAYRDRLRARFGARAVGDLSALFVSRLLAALEPGGRLCVIVPNKLLATGYASALRAALLEQCCLEAIWDLSAGGIFPGWSAYPVILVARREAPSPEHRIEVRNGDGTLRAAWPRARLTSLPGHVLPLGLDAKWLPLVERLLAGPRLGDAQVVGCGIAASGFGRAIGDGPEWIVQSSDVSGYRVRGAQRFAPRRAGIPERQIQRQRVPKVLVPGMFRRLCAAYDGEGRLLGRVYFLPAHDAEGRPDPRRRALLLALLNSRLYATLYGGLFAGVAQSGGYMRLNAPLLRCLPWPTRPAPPALDRMVCELEGGAGPETQARLDDLVETLFGLSDAERLLFEPELGEVHPATPAAGRKRSRRESGPAAHPRP